MRWGEVRSNGGLPASAQQESWLAQRLSWINVDLPAQRIQRQIIAHFTELLGNLGASSAGTKNARATANVMTRPTQGVTLSQLARANRHS
jgi:DNA recombination-dependent growth factor C